MTRLSRLTAILATLLPAALAPAAGPAAEEWAAFDNPGKFIAALCASDAPSERGEWNATLPPASSRESRINRLAASYPAVPADQGKGHEKIGIVSSEIVSPEIAEIETDPKTPEDIYRPMSLDDAARLASLVQKDRYVELVSFRSAYEMPSDGSDPPMPSTYKKQTPKNVVLHIDGFLGLLEEIHLAPPPLGRFSGDVVVEMQWGGDEAFHRVQALDSDWNLAAPSAAWWARSRITRTLLAVECKKGGGILDAWFFGPLRAGEEKGLREFVDYLLAHPFEKIPKADAEALALRPNVWMSLLGLARLKELQVHTPKVFFEAMRRVPAESVPGLLTDLVDYAAFFKEAEKQELLRELAAFVDSAEPPRQLALLDRLIWLQQQHQFDGMLVLTDDLVKALRKQAAARSGQKEWADVVVRYQALLGLLMKVSPDKGAAQ